MGIRIEKIITTLFLIILRNVKIRGAMFDYFGMIIEVINRATNVMTNI